MQLSNVKIVPAELEHFDILHFNLLSMSLGCCNHKPLSTKRPGFVIPALRELQNIKYSISNTKNVLLLDQESPYFSNWELGSVNVDIIVPGKQVSFLISSNDS